MKAYLTIPSSNQLRFVNRGYYSITPNRIDTRLFRDIEFQDALNIGYSQKIQQTDTLLVQFCTSYPDFSIYLINNDTQEVSDLTGTQTIAGTYIENDGEDTEITVYNLVVQTGNLNGCYYLIINGISEGFPIVEFHSEPFEVLPLHENTIQIKYIGNDNFNDGLIWGDTQQQIRINAKLFKVLPKYESKTYKDSYNALTTLKYYPNCSHILDIDNIPFYLVEKLMLAFGHDEVYIDGVRYNIDNEFDVEPNQNNLMVSFELPLILVNYENYNANIELSGTLPTIQPTYLMVDDDTMLLINNNGFLQLK